MRAGCIDIGSNTTRLLVAERVGGRLCELLQERAFTRIGRGLAPGDLITPEKIDEVVAVVVTQLRSAAEWGATDVRGVATAAVRDAANGPELVAAIVAATGLEVEILSGEEEARLAFVGAAATLEHATTGQLGVVDVGGGSSEMVVGVAPATISWWASVALGSSTLTDQWLHADPPAPAQLAAARRHVAARLAEIRPPIPQMAVAVGGSATSLRRLAGVVLDAGALVRSLRLLATETSAEVAARAQIDPQRARLLPAGLLILEAMAARFQTTITVGRGGIREGVVLEALSA
jgi:exopolyphosphatase / guanosine-5'-triphosphate,3'-diphosphate pyrophosphatase